MKLDLDMVWFSNLHWIFKHNFWIGFDKHKSLHLRKRPRLKVIAMITKCKTTLDHDNVSNMLCPSGPLVKRKVSALPPC